MPEVAQAEIDLILFDLANQKTPAQANIIIWHFFFVLFHPEEYPMALSWLTGRLPVESMEERHPRELERLRAEGAIVTPGAEDTGPSTGEGPASTAP